MPARASEFRLPLRSQKCWVITHPFIAGKAKKISNEARALSEILKKDSLLDHDAEGGRIDAFRHAYWMARMAQTFCWKKALSLGKAHEKGNFKQFKKGRKDEENVLPDSASSEMDLFNNKIGVAIGCENKMLSPDELQLLIRKSVLDGKLLIIHKNGQGVPLDCGGRTIKPEDYIGVWNIPKCLVPSGL